MKRFRNKKPGSRATIREVAAKAGVSPATASRVMNHHPQVGDAVRARVLKAMEALGYGIGTAGHGSPRRKSYTLGLIVPDITNPFYAESANIIIDICRGRGYHVILCNSENLPGFHREQIDLLRKRRVDGIIFGSVLYDEPEVEQLIASGYPCIQYNRRLRSRIGNYVVADNVRAGHEVTAHLLSRGHRRVGFIAGALETSTAQERLAGYRQALDAAGIPVRDDLVRQGAYKPAAALRAAEELIKRDDPPTAIIGSSDVMALSVLQVAGELGLRVPEDLAVAGIDDIDIAVHHNIQLTTVSHHATEMAELAARWILEIVDDPQRFIRQPFQCVLRPTLVIRRTCGAVGSSVGGGRAGDLALRPRGSAPA